MSESHETHEEYRGFIIAHRSRAWYVYGADLERISNAFASKDEAMQFVERHIRRGGK